jgi:hypothetical protein
MNRDQIWLIISNSWPEGLGRRARPKAFSHRPLARRHNLPPREQAARRAVRVLPSPGACDRTCSKISRGEIEDVKHLLPSEVRALWPAADK